MIRIALTTARLQSGLALCGGAFLFAATAFAGISEKCLVGTAADVTNDASQIRAVRTLVDSACPCASFNGTKMQTHEDYTMCAAHVISDQIAMGALRSNCKLVVKKMVA